jgi:serine/threonine protein kinase
MAVQTSAEDIDQLVLPRAFGPYVLVSLLGRGGMGEVFLAMRGGIEGISRRCVVKTLRPGFGEDREYVARFLDEARVVVQLLHRNICPVFDVGKVDGRYYLAMEYISGRDLRSVSERLAAAGRPLHLTGNGAGADGAGDLGLATHIVGEVLEALEHAHTSNDPATGEPLFLVHRDVSPHNVMVGFDGDVRLIDFGLAASTLKAEHTAPNIVMGKVAYMSPEQICGDPLDAAADQFSAAIMAVELFTGERFYGSLSNREIYAHAATGGYRPASMARLPEALRAILDRALAADRRHRFPSCGAMRSALDSWRHAAGTRGDGSLLRTRMREVFGDDIGQERVLLSRAAAAAGLSPDALGSRPMQASVPPADTDRMASAIVSSPQARGSGPIADPDLQLTVSSPSAAVTRGPPTSAHITVQEPSSRPRWAVAAGVLGAVAVGLVAVLVFRSPPPPKESTPVAAVVLPAPVQLTPPTPVPNVEPVPEPAADPPVVPTVEPVAAMSAAPNPRKHTKSTAATPIVPTGPTTAAPTTDAPPSTAPPGIKLRWLKRTCPSLACTPALVARVDWGRLEPGALQAFQSSLQVCVTECQRR